MNPQHVDVAPGGVAYVTTNKYRCDTTTVMHAVTVHVIPPDDFGALSIPIDDNVSMDYCGQGDPGSILHISPVEPTYLATIAH